MSPGATPAAPSGRDVFGNPAPSLAGYSRFVQRVRRRYADWLPLLADQVPNARCLAIVYATLQAQGFDCAASLRVLRQLVVERLARMDCDEQAALATVTACMTDLAEFALDQACSHAQAQATARHGVPQAPGGAVAKLWIVGMGKLGSRSLNVSSDIDLVYVYDHAGHTAGVDNGRGGITGVLSNQEYFSAIVKGIYQLVGETTEHGWVFRMDLALRPNGESGPAALPLDALDEYFQVQGREWERFAWAKSRVVAPRVHAQDGSALALRAVVLPFVFRRYVDWNVLAALRVLHGQIRAHANRRAAGRPERANDVKLGRGGIRELEFTVQLLQVVRGANFRSCAPGLL